MTRRWLPAVVLGVTLALAGPALWRKFKRTTNTQVHRVNQ